MATAVQEKKPPQPSRELTEGTSGSGGRFQVHKPGEGYATRLGSFVLSLAFVFFACHHWFYGWKFIRNLLDGFFQGISTKLRFLLAWTIDSNFEQAISICGAIVLFLLGGLAAFYVIYVMPRSAEFLVKTDGELAKVTWPKVTPWFKAEAKVWGSTYVVLVMLAILTFYILVVDQLLILFSRFLFYGSS